MSYILKEGEQHSPKKDIRIERLNSIGEVTETIILSKRREMDYSRFLITLYENGINDDFIEPTQYMMTPADGIVKL